MEINLEGLEFRLTCGEYQVTGGFDVKYQADDTDVPAWARLSLSEELIQFLKDNPADSYAMELGNDAGYELLVSGRGTFTSEGTLIIKGAEETSAEHISAFFLNATLQEAARYLLTVFGVRKYQMTDVDYGRRKNFRIDAASYQDALRQLNAVYQADIIFYMQNRCAYYGVQSDQDGYYQLADDNILDIDKNGDIWTAEIIPVPGIHPRQVVQLACEEYTGAVQIIACTIEGDESGIDMWIKFREINDG
ncbi:hypothetical protein [Parablautia sp. Marseille-Q6255]|uniref:hypothetical protein n=1 Tax=Parablautia sp. Marseille-Q6255 TaxID=3039593 RepID=UPI0024BC57C2|nr:hypothetical protein [Parablautia sp. Marseille-Q6255]